MVSTPPIFMVRVSSWSLFFLAIMYMIKSRARKQDFLRQFLKLSFLDGFLGP